jgi:ATP-dependent Lon protease
VRRYDFGVAEKENQIGQVVGLAWTEVGGDLLTIEAMTMPGKGNDSYRYARRCDERIHRSSHVRGS